jgi:hypothetical protein
MRYNEFARDMCRKNFIGGDKGKAVAILGSECEYQGQKLNISRFSFIEQNLQVNSAGNVKGIFY